MGEFPVERGYVWTSCASVENGNPLFWDDEVADGAHRRARSPRRPWSRSGSAPTTGRPGRTEQALPLQVHFDLKERFGLPEAVMTDNTIEFHEPVRLGDVLRDPPGPALGQRREDDQAGHRPVLGDRRRVPQPGRRAGGRRVLHRLRLPAGRRRMTRHRAAAPAARRRRRRATSCPTLDYEVTATTVVLGALATRDWRPMHHDKDFAVNRNGTQDIFLNTPNQAAWFERYLTDWTGPHGRLGRVDLPHAGLGLPRRHHGRCAGVVGVDRGRRGRLRLRHGGA